MLVSRYSVNVGGVRIGDATIHATLDAKHYKVTVSADVGVLLNNTKVQGEASGLRAGAKLTPEHFHLATSDGQESSVDFAAAAAAATAKGAKANPLRGVLDPLSALLVTSLRPPTTDAPCNNVVPVLMSRARFDVSLRPKTSGEERDPRIVTCQVNFTAIATPGGNSAAALQKVQWEVNFQKLSKPHWWLVEQISLPTDMGTMTLERVETAISG